MIQAWSSQVQWTNHTHNFYRRINLSWIKRYSYYCCKK